MKGFDIMISEGIVIMFGIFFNVIDYLSNTLWKTQHGWFTLTEWKQHAMIICMYCSMKQLKSSVSKSV